MSDTGEFVCSCVRCTSHRAVYCNALTTLATLRSSASAEIARDADDVQRPFKVIQGYPLLCQSTRNI